MPKYKPGTQSIGAMLLAKKEDTPVNKPAEVVKEQPVVATTPLPAPKDKTPQKDNAAPISEGKKEGKQYTFTVSVEDLLTNIRRYKNSSLRLTIDEKYRNVIAMVAEYSKTDMAQIVNNMIGTFLNNDEVVQELKNYCTKCQRERLSSLMDK